jgi:YVTN family beta-propeller protein
MGAATPAAPRLDAAVSYPVIATIAVSGPTGAAVNSLNNRVYVTNFEDNTVTVINGGANKVTATIPVGHHPAAIAVNPVTNTVYAANFIPDRTVSVIDGQTKEVTATIPVGRNPYAVR